jgi:SAM-dependent methyltransferase
MVDGSVSEWRDPEHVLDYLARADTFPHRAEGEGVLLDHVPRDARRILDLGTGDGRLLALLRIDRREMLAVGLDFSEVILQAARKRFADDEHVELVKHDLAEPLPTLGRFDAVVSSFAIHHLEHERKRSLYGEIFDLLEPGGVNQPATKPTVRSGRRTRLGAAGRHLGNRQVSDFLSVSSNSACRTRFARLLPFRYWFRCGRA